MKNLILFLLLITVTRFYAQNEGTILKYNGLLNSTNIKVILLENEYQSIFDEIKNFEPSFIESNSEGKFLKYRFTNDIAKSLKETKIHVKNKSTLKSNSLVIALKNDFINKTTQELLEDEIVKTYGNKEYFKYDKHVVSNKLNKTIYNDQVTVQIGNSITKYLNKLYKSDVDKTFLNELNLLVVSF